MKKSDFRITSQSLAAILITTALFFSPALADTAATAVAADDPFSTTFTKISGWTTGTAGKLITLTAFIMAGISGVAGFRPAIVFGCLGVGIVLAGSSSVVDVLFKTQ